MLPLETKESIRTEALRRRASLKSRCVELSAIVSAQFLEHIAIPPGAVISSYWSIGDEADPATLEQELRVRGHRIVMPRVVARNHPLDFHLWEAGAQLIRGGFGLSQPGPDWPKLSPDILIVPLLAFDEHGYRIGYGAGYYDRTIAALRQAKQVVAVGFAFAAQEFPALPYSTHDERLDWVVTEIGTRKIRNN